MQQRTPARVGQMTSRSVPVRVPLAVGGRRWRMRRVASGRRLNLDPRPPPFAACVHLGQGYRIPVRSHHVAFGNGGNRLIRVLSARLKLDFNWSIGRLWSLVDDLLLTQIFVGVLEDHLRLAEVTK